MRPTSAGFTLIETLIVVALVAVLAGVAAPSVAAGMARYNLGSAAQQVTSTVRSGRFQAVGRNTALKVRFDFPATGQYQIVDAADAPVGEVQYLPSGIAFDEPVDIQITTAGRMAAAVTITVTDGNDDSARTITVATSGRVTLE